MRDDVASQPDQPGEDEGFDRDALDSVERDLNDIDAALRLLDDGPDSLRAALDAADRDGSLGERPVFRVCAEATGSSEPG